MSRARAWATCSRPRRSSPASGRQGITSRFLPTANGRSPRWGSLGPRGLRASTFTSTRRACRLATPCAGTSGAFLSTFSTGGVCVGNWSPSSPTCSSPRMSPSAWLRPISLGSRSSAWTTRTSCSTSRPPAGRTFSHFYWPGPRRPCARRAPPSTSSSRLGSAEGARPACVLSLRSSSRRSGSSNPGGEATFSST